MTEEQIVEVLSFFHGCGGRYKRLLPIVVMRIIECLERNRFYLERDEAGKIVQVVCYWKIREADFERAKQYWQPDNPDRGPVFFITDFASAVGVIGMARFTELLDEYVPDTSMVCFERKGRFVVWDRFNNSKREWIVRR